MCNSLHSSSKAICCTSLNINDDPVEDAEEDVEDDDDDDFLLFLRCGDV